MKKILLIALFGAIVALIGTSADYEKSPPGKDSQISYTIDQENQIAVQLELRDIEKHSSIPLEMNSEIISKEALSTATMKPLRDIAYNRATRRWHRNHSLLVELRTLPKAAPTRLYPAPEKIC